MEKELARHGKTGLKGEKAACLSGNKKREGEGERERGGRIPK